MPKPPDHVKVMTIYPFDEPMLERMRSAAPDRVEVVPMFADLFDEMNQESPGQMVRYFRNDIPKPLYTPEEREALIAQADVVYLSLPGPRTLPARAKNAKWFHIPFAGVSNLRGTAFWGIDAMVTSSRGVTQALPIAEMVVASAFLFAKRLDLAVKDTMEGKVGAFGTRPIPKTRVVAGMTMGVIGLGGIGRDVARLSKAVGMRVVANRWSAERRMTDVEGVDELFPAGELHHMLGRCDFVAVCAMLTDTNEGMINTEAFASMKDGAFLMNIARGEVVDEPALIEALRSGKLGGAYIDVWPDDTEVPPNAELAAQPNAVFTPHISGMTDVSHTFGLDLFCENLGRFMKGEPLQNVVDWARGY